MNSFFAYPLLPAHYYAEQEDDDDLSNDDSPTLPEPIEMPDGTKGYICHKCHDYFSYVEPNCKKGYVCYDCRRTFLILTSTSK